MVLYRFGSTGVVQVLTRAAELLGLVPVFPVRNVGSFSSGTSGNNAVFRDCVLVSKNTTVAEVARKVMGDAPLAYVEGAGGVRVAEDDLVAVGKNDVSTPRWPESRILTGGRFYPLKWAEHDVFGTVGATGYFEHSKRRSIKYSCIECIPTAPQDYTKPGRFESGDQ
jgi:hypothetical protein